MFQMMSEEQMTGEEAEKVYEPSDSEMRFLYKQKFGHFPKGRMKPETIRERVNGLG
jgi:hypothetical protein